MPCLDQCLEPSKGHLTTFLDSAIKHRIKCINWPKNVPYLGSRVGGASWAVVKIPGPEVESMYESFMGFDFVNQVQFVKWGEGEFYTSLSSSLPDWDIFRRCIFASGLGCVPTVTIVGRSQNQWWTPSIHPRQGLPGYNTDNSATPPSSGSSTDLNSHFDTGPSTGSRAPYILAPSFWTNDGSGPRTSCTATEKAYFRSSSF